MDALMRTFTSAEVIIRLRVFIRKVPLWMIICTSFKNGKIFGYKFSLFIPITSGKRARFIRLNFTATRNIDDSRKGAIN